MHRTLTSSQDVSQQRGDFPAQSQPQTSRPLTLITLSSSVEDSSLSVTKLREANSLELSSNGERLMHTHEDSNTAVPGDVTGEISTLRHELNNTRHTKDALLDANRVIQPSFCERQDRIASLEKESEERNRNKGSPDTELEAQKRVSTSWETKFKDKKRISTSWEAKFKDETKASASFRRKLEKQENI